MRNTNTLSLGTSSAALIVTLALASMGTPAQAAISPGSAGVVRWADNNLCLDATNTNLAARTCNGSAAQNWSLRQAGDWLQLVSATTGQCLDIDNAGKAPGTAALRWNCHTDPNQRFSLRALNAGHAIVTSYSGQCLQPSGTASGSAVALQACNPATALQRVQLSPAMWPSAPQRSASSGLCMDIYNGATTSGGAVIQWTCHGGANQDWRLNPVGDGSFEWRVRHSQMCLTVPAGSTQAGAALVQAPCDGSAHQRFHPRASAQGYQWVAAHSGQCLDVNQNSLTAGATIIQWPCHADANQVWQRDGRTTPMARWSPVQAISLVPAAAANLPDGRVVFWSAYDRMAFGGDAGRTYTSTYDPTTGVASEALVSVTGHDMFCPGIANLPDGRLHVTGGSSSQKTSLYNPATNSWSAAAPMNVARGYQGSVTLSTGEVFTFGGSWSGGTGGKVGETWSSSNTWRRQDNLTTPLIETSDAQGVYRSDNHAWLFADADGKVLHAGPSRQMNWLDTRGAGSATSAGRRADDDHAMNGNAVLYDVRKVLVVGGAVNYSNDAAATQARNSAFLINYAAGTVTSRRIGGMGYARAYHNSVVLPNGEVVITGGQARPQPFTDDQAPLVPEIWSPRTEGFLAMSQNPMAQARTYHSVALMLPDGRVLTGGGGLCGGCSVNHPNTETFSPPYLLNPDGTEALRPRITQAPATASVGGSIAVQTSQPVSAFALLRLSSVTHSLNNEQRRVPLNFSSTSPTSHTVSLPADRGALIPGYYMLFALNANGVPSPAHTLRVP